MTEWISQPVSISVIVNEYYKLNAFLLRSINSQFSEGRLVQDSGIRQPNYKNCSSNGHKSFIQEFTVIN